MEQDKLEIKNARIVSTFLGFEDHGIFTFVLYLDYGGGGQGYGTYRLDNKGKGTAFGLEAVIRVLNTVGVDKWEALKDKYIRAEANWSKVTRIGNLLTDDWLDLEEVAKEYKELVNS